jgi:peptidoglycan/LPS O-acetylase OafA/YrhL
MSQRITRSNLKRRKRNSLLIALAWIVGLAAVVIFLLYKEMADWLYVLATLGVTVLLIVVAVADLKGRRKGVDESELGDDAAALGSNIPASTMPAATASSSDWRAQKARRRK